MVDATWNLAHVDDESDLTELSSDEDVSLVSNEHEIPGPPRRTNSTVFSACKIPRKTTRLSTQEATQRSKARTKDKWPIPAVEPHKTVSYSASYLYGLINKGMIELNPEYQRGIVWSEVKQSNFINSLYHQFHAPEIVFNLIRDPTTGSRLRTCMDGKQRLTSICNFFDGKIPLMPYLNAADAPGYARRKFWSKKISNVTRPLVPAHVMETLETCAIACVEYSNLSPDLEREIFQRVQHGVPLTPSDRLPAINGPWADIVRGLRNRMNTTEGFEGYLDWGKARGKDFQALAQIVYLAVNGTSPKKAYPSSQRIETFLNSTDGKPSSVKNQITKTMDIFCRIARTPNIDDPLTKDLSPLEFVMATFLIFQQRTSLTDRQLSDAICRMREHAKRRSEDLKFDQPNFKVFLDFVLKNLPKLVDQLVTPEEDEKPAAFTPYKRRESMVDRFKYNASLDTEMDSAVGKSTPPVARGANASGKRKRGPGDDDGVDAEDDDAAWTVEAPAMKSRVKKGSKVVDRQKDAESKARTTVKKSSQKNVPASPSIRTPPPKVTSSKFDGQVGRPSIRPTSSMSMQQSSGTALPQLRNTTGSSGVVDSIPALQTGRFSVSSRQRDSQILKASVDSRTNQQAVIDGESPGYVSRSQPQGQARIDIAHDRPRPMAVGGVPSSTIVVTRNPGPFSVSRHPPSEGISSPATTYINRHDYHGNMAQRAYLPTGARNFKQNRL